MKNEILAKVVFFLLDLLLLIALFYLCEKIGITQTTLKIIISNIIAVPLSYWVSRSIVKSRNGKSHRAS